MSEVTTQPENTEEIKEKIIGEFKPKRKFLNFVSAVNGIKIRFIRDIAFIKGGKLSGMLDDAVFKITICDEGTINFEEVDTTLTDKAQRQRLINDIDEIDVTGYAQKFVVAGLEFADKDGGRCYLEVETKKPIDKLKSLFDDKAEVSVKGLSILDQLFGDSTEPETSEVEAVAEPVVEKVEEKSVSSSYMEESFRKMNENKVIELKGRIEDKEKEIQRTKSDISNAEKKLKESSESLGVLETRLDSMTGTIEPNGYVFYISEEQKNETGLDETTKGIADKIANLMNLKKDILFKYLTGGFYKIKIAKKDDLKSEVFVADKEIYEKLSSIDVLGKITLTGIGEFEYRGELNWHQLVGKMIRKGFEQDPKFDEFCLSNSYESKEEGKDEKKGCGCSEGGKCGGECDGKCSEGGYSDGQCGCGSEKVETPIVLAPKVEDKTQLINNDNMISGFKFKISTSNEVGTTVEVVNDEDFTNGFSVSYEFPEEVHTLMDNIGCSELMEGVWEICSEDGEVTNLEISQIRNQLVSAGLEEIRDGIRINRFGEMEGEFDEESGNAELESLEEEFEEQNGYPIGDEFIFAIYEDDGEISIPITPKSYWDNERCQYDGHIQEIIENRFPLLRNIPDFGESCESTFESSLDMNGIVEELCKSGIKFSRGFQDFISQKDTQDVVNIITQLGFQNIIIA